MKLVVSKYEADATKLLDCSFCAEDAQDQHYTVTSFYDDEGSGMVVTVCPEHLNDMVVAALSRHKEAMQKDPPNPFWYLDEDPDPWE